MKCGEDKGLYKIRTPLSKKDFAYVTGLYTSTFADEAEYRERGCQPAFEALPWKEDYDSRLQAKHADNNHSRP